MIWIAVLGAGVAAAVSVVATARAYVQLERPLPAGRPAAGVESSLLAVEGLVEARQTSAAERSWMVSTLARSELCRKLDRPAVERIAASTFVRRFRAGDRIFSQGTVGDSMFVVGEGEVQLVVQSDFGEEIVLDRRSATEFFGEFAMLDGQPRTTSAVATEPTRLIVLTRESLHQLLREPQVVDVLLRGLVDMIREADRQTAGQPPPDLLGKVAQDIVKQVQVDQEVLRRSEIAERVGEPPQRVSRVLRFFAERGFVLVGDDSVVVRNLEGLRRQAAARHG
jgi:CRP/FNR family cyclic AMP-dependent transcriptional regulator